MIFIWQFAPHQKRREIIRNTIEFLSAIADREVEIKTKKTKKMKYTKITLLCREISLTS